MSTLRTVWAFCVAFCIAKAAHAQVYPVPDWVVVAPELQGMDSRILGEAAQLAGRMNSYCLVVARRGQIVGEWYWWDYDQTKPDVMWSTTKSVTAMLVGVAEKEGFFTAASRVSQFIPEFRSHTWAANITVGSILTMDSGRHYDPITDFVLPAFEHDQTQFAIRLPQAHAPDTKHQYAQMAFQLLDRVFVVGTGMHIADFARKHLFGPIGMSTTSWDADKAGNPLTYAGLRTTCRDAARFGHLMLNKGSWPGLGTPAWTPEFHKRSIAPSPINQRKGYCWSLKSDYIEARGLGGQVIQVDEERELVVTRIGLVAVEASPAQVYEKVKESVKR